jgi:hypothetical protein
VSLHTVAALTVLGLLFDSWRRSLDQPQRHVSSAATPAASDMRSTINEALASAARIARADRDKADAYQSESYRAECVKARASFERSLR